MLGLRRIANRLRIGFRDAVDLSLFRLRGMKPWTRGYETYRWKCIEEGVGRITDPRALPTGYGYRVDERVVEYPWFFSRLPEGGGRLLDAGSILNHHQIICHRKLQDKSIWISTLANEGRAFFQNNISYVYEDMRDLCYKDNFFDFVVCISTLEHVGMDNTMLYTDNISKLEHDPDAFIGVLQELRRVLKPGGSLFLTVPFGLQQNHGWFQVFDASMLDRAIGSFSPDTLNEQIYQYFEDGWTLSSRDNAAEATYFDIHSRDNYDADYAAASRAVAALEMTK